MTDFELFEERFGQAYRRYLDKAPRPPAPATVARTVTAVQRRPRVLVWPSLRSRVPVLVWMVLLGLLLVAFAAAALFIGSQRPSLGFACPPGSTPNSPGPVAQARPLLDSASRPEPNIRMAFDRRAGRIVAIASAAGGVETWTFDVCTNTWQQMHPFHEPVGLDGWDRPVYDVDSDLTIVVDRDHPMDIWAYDLPRNSWTHRGFAPLDTTPVAYDPVTGLVIAADYATGLWDYDVEANAWTPIPQANGPDSVQVFAYDASVDRLVAYAEPIGGERTWLLDIREGRWSESGATTPTVVWGMYRPAVAYDEAAKRTVVGLQAYDATGDRWESLTDDYDPAFRRTGPMVYDPVNQRLVGFREGDSLATADLLGFDVLTQEWTVLLEAQSPTARRGAP